MTNLKDPVTLGDLELPHRLVMAPMTRNRADAAGRVGAATVDYYRQRASAGLIVTESIQPSPTGQGYPLTPGLHTADQIQAWTAVTDAVHRAGGRIIAQLTHVGRIGHQMFLPAGELPVAPSAVPSGEPLFTADGPIDRPTPRELGIGEIPGIVDDFAAAARAAIAAGFDGVEIHGGNGFLIHQFLADNTNLRTDAYGGSIAGRSRFALEVVSAVADAVGAGRTGIRLSPNNPYNGIHEQEPLALYSALLARLSERSLAYVHLIETADRDLTAAMRPAFAGQVILNPHPEPGVAATPAIAQKVLKSGVAEAISLGQAWLANPDLLNRIAAGGPFNEPDPATFYGGDERGYTDYPTLTELEARSA